MGERELFPSNLSLFFTLSEIFRWGQFSGKKKVELYLLIWWELCYLACVSKEFMYSLCFCRI